MIKHRHPTYAEDCEDAGKKGHLQAKGSGFVGKQSCWHFDLGLLASRLEDNTILLFKPPGLWFFVMGVADGSRL